MSQDTMSSRACSSFWILFSFTVSSWVCLDLWKIINHSHILFFCLYLNRCSFEAHLYSSCWLDTLVIFKGGLFWASVFITTIKRMKLYIHLLLSDSFCQQSFLAFVPLFDDFLLLLKLLQTRLFPSAITQNENLNKCICNFISERPNKKHQDYERSSVFQNRSNLQTQQHPMVWVWQIIIIKILIIVCWYSDSVFSKYLVQIRIWIRETLFIPERNWVRCGQCWGSMHEFNEMWTTCVQDRQYCYLYITQITCII